MAARKAKTATATPRKTTKSPPRNKSKALNRISIAKRGSKSEFGDPDEDLGPIGDFPGENDTDYGEGDVELGDELGLDGEFSAEELGPESGLGSRELPPLTPRPTRKSNHTIFPDPGGFKLSWDAGRQYWKSVWDDPRTRPRLRVYIYRWFPAMLDEKNPKTGMSYRQVVRLDGDAPDSQPDKQAKPLSISEILHRYGVGDYGFKLNDAGAGNQQICQFALVDRSDMRDWENHPPILDPDGLDLADPINATYIKRMKSRQKWDSEEEKEENMQALERMADRMVKLAEKQSERKSTEDGAKAAEVVAHAATLGQDLLAKSVERLISGQGGGSSDPMVMVTALVELVKGMKGENQLEIISTVMQRAAEAERAAYNAQIQGLNNTVQQLMAKMDERRSNPESQAQDDPLDRYRKMLEMKDIMADLFEKGGSARGPKEPAWLQYMPLLAPALNSIPTLVNGLVSRWGAPQAAQPTQRPTPSPGMQAPNQLPGTQQEQSAVIALLEQLRPPLLRYLNEGRSGYDFAALYIDWFGEDDYNRIAAQPPEVIMQIFASYPPIWGDLAPRQQKVLQFLQEFVSEPPEEEAQQQESRQESQHTRQSRPNGGAQGPTQVPTQEPMPPIPDQEPEKKTGKRARP